VNIAIEGRFHSNKFLGRQNSDSKSRAVTAARIQESAGWLKGLAVHRSKKISKKSNAMLRCDCHHAKSIHSRMYANQKLGTPCNFPFCKCKAYKPK
jgi:hypothetical protein